MLKILIMLKGKQKSSVIFFRSKWACYSSYKKEILPRHIKKIYLPDPTKTKKLNNQMASDNGHDIQDQSMKTNEFNIQMLSRSIYKQIFKNNNKYLADRSVIDHCLNTLRAHGLLQNFNCNNLADVDFKLPPLKGKDLIEHFYLIGEEQAKPYKVLLDQLLISIPPMPRKWLMKPGWIRYYKDSKPECVPYPLENVFVFDVEVCVKAGKLPTLATAVSDKAWYAWVNEVLTENVEKPIKSTQLSLSDLIPMETDVWLSNHKKQARIIIGHNVSYDRARIKEQYYLKQTDMRFLDTMSLHISVSGLTSSQRAILKSEKLKLEDSEWKNYTSLNSLREVHKLYCGTSVEKETRDLFVSGSLYDIQKQFDKVITYCAKDVLATYNVFKVLYPMFLERFPHPVTFAGMIELSTAYLPVNDTWERYIADSEQTYEDLHIENNMLLAKRADEACQLFHMEQYKNDLWMWDQDWSVKELTLKKTRNLKVDRQVDRLKDNTFVSMDLKDAKDVEENEDEELTCLKTKFAYLEKKVELLPAVKSVLPGYPKWYRKLCTKPDLSATWTPGPQLISTSMQITPKLLCLTWEGYPLHFIKELGWGFLVPFSYEMNPVGKIPLEKLVNKCPLSLKNNKAKHISIDICQEVDRKISCNYYKSLKQNKICNTYSGSGIQCNMVLDDCCWFIKLPHKDGSSHRVGNPLAKDFLSKFYENVLSGDTEVAQKVVSISNQLSYWKNNKARIIEQMVVWLERKFLPPQLKNDEKKYGAIIPQIVVCGTLTRRAVEPTWMTASNVYLDRIGSELRSMVQAPKGYKIVGADVDSQELWIASILGDAHCAKLHGATPFGYMTISGNKADGTDMHSVTAKASGISRDQAKIINYARIYGAGQNFAEQLIKQFNPTMSKLDARSKAIKMFNLTKGKRVYRLKKEHLLELPDKLYGRWEAQELAKIHNRTLDEMFYKPKWVGGTESAMFNRLEEIANDPQPTTPFLNCRLSRALEPKLCVGDQFLPTRINWIVQSGAVDFLHLMLVCMRWLMNDKARFCLSFHDEVRYLVKENYQYKAALAMHVTNLLTRAFCSLKLGIDDLPQSVAFFSSVEVDSVLRKDSKQDCRTPSNPHGLQKGYGIPFGESLDIYEAIKKANGHSEWWKDMKSDVKGNKKETCTNGGSSG
ncbi:DNA polymerase subunit gamma-1, mitochondrial isoform X1 [Agrilus planipennis]|uniref:DNA polymerase subunit gamma-1 n=1 Tax=Agrilus planipennis TaxID=224129 RepID=A0A7F5R291_AGRPL|nr:DNA polymerase subunit gamma-1, mitochondrial isoform X1 [Agrilus planipennis]